MATMMSASEFLQARRFAALGDPTRLEVFRLLSRSPQSVTEIASRLPVSRPAVSQHLKVLADAGLVSFDTVGTRNVYRPNSETVASMRDFIDGLWGIGLDRLRKVAEAAARKRKDHDA